jgi:rhodanese-related sulfurtransferase
MKCKKMVALVAAGIMVFAFSIPSIAQERDWPEVVDQYVANAKKSVTVVKTEDFRKMLDKLGDAVVLDVREPDEFKSGHLPGAINIPRGLVEFRIWKAVAGYPAKTDTGKKIYIYCRTGGRCVLAAKSLMDLGFTNVFAVDIKIVDWIKAGYPIER